MSIYTYIKHLSFVFCFIFFSVVIFPLSIQFLRLPLKSPKAILMFTIIYREMHDRKKVFFSILSVFIIVVRVFVAPFVVSTTFFLSLRDGEWRTSSEEDNTHTLQSSPFFPALYMEVPLTLSPSLKRFIKSFVIFIVNLFLHSLYRLLRLLENFFAFSFPFFGSAYWPFFHYSALHAFFSPFRLLFSSDFSNFFRGFSFFLFFFLLDVPKFKS